MEYGKPYKVSKLVINSGITYSHFYLESKILGRIEITAEEVTNYLSNEGYVEVFDDDEPEHRYLSHKHLHIILTIEEEAKFCWPMVQERYALMSERYDKLTHHFEEEVNKLSGQKYVREIVYQSMSVFKNFLPPIKSRYTKYDRFRINVVCSLLRSYCRARRAIMSIESCCDAIQKASGVKFDVYKLVKNKELVEFKEEEEK